MTRIKWRAVGNLSISVGTALNVSGAILNAMHIQLAFLIWMVSNLLCAIYFFGAWRGFWKVDGPADQKMFAMYLIFIGTAVTGWIL